MAKSNQPKQTAGSGASKAWDQPMVQGSKLPLRLVLRTKAGSADIALGQNLLMEPTQDILKKWRGMARRVEIVY